MILRIKLLLQISNQAGAMIDNFLAVLLVLHVACVARIVILQAKFLALRDTVAFSKPRSFLDLFSVFHGAGSLVHRSPLPLRIAFQAPSRRRTACCARGTASRLGVAETGSISKCSPNNTRAQALESPVPSIATRLPRIHEECRWLNRAVSAALAPAS